MEEIETFLNKHGVPYAKSIDDDFVKYIISDPEHKRMKIELWIARGIEKRYSIYISTKGIFINYEPYDALSDILLDLEVVLRAKVDLDVVMQNGKTIKNVFELRLKPEANPSSYKVIEYLNKLNLFLKKTHSEASFAPWI